MKKYAIGIDIGGTKISITLGTRLGKVLSKRVIPTRTGAQTRHCLKDLSRNIQALIEENNVRKREIAGIGIGCPGAVDSRIGKVPRSPHLKGWEGTPLKRLIEKEFRLPVTLGNDANAAALAEKIFGAGKKTPHFIYMTVSTGVGGGIVVDGRLLTGASFVAGEIGHMVIEADGDPWEMNEFGVLEAYASGTAMARWLEKEVRKKSPAKLKLYRNEKGKVTAKKAAKLAREGDRLAVKAFERGGHYLGIGIANLLNILNPEKVIIGGGVLKTAPAVFWRSMLTSCRRRAWTEAFKAVEISRSKLGDKVGDLGALALAFDETV